MLCNHTSPNSMSEVHGSFVKYNLNNSTLYVAFFMEIAICVYTCDWFCFQGEGCTRLSHRLLFRGITQSDPSSPVIVSNWGPYKEKRKRRHAADRQFRFSLLILDWWGLGALELMSRGRIHRVDIRVKTWFRKGRGLLRHSSFLGELEWDAPEWLFNTQRG